MEAKKAQAERARHFAVLEQQTHALKQEIENLSRTDDTSEEQFRAFILEEVSAKMGGLKQFSGLLKDRISSTTMLLELKNKERKTIPWYANVVIFSNEFNILSVSRHDRRLVMFQSDPSKSNNKAYFTQVYKELDDLEILRAEFQYYRDFDIGDWNYRAIPHSAVKDKLVACCEKNVTKFHRIFMKHYSGRVSYEVTGEDIYESYKEYCYTHGIRKPSNRHNVVANLRLHLPWITKNDDTYSFNEVDRARFLQEIS